MQIKTQNGNNWKTKKPILNKSTLKAKISDISNVFLLTTIIICLLLF